MKIGDELEPGADYDRAKAKMMAASVDEPGRAVLELFAKLEEAKKALKAMTEYAAELAIDTMAQRRRINELLQSNNAFEERARQAEREVARLRGYKLVDPG